MGLQLIPSFVESVYRFEESTRVRRVDRNWDAQLSGGVPHRIESPIINSDQRTGRNLPAKKQPERLQNLQAFCTGAHGTFDLVNLLPRVIWLIDSAPSRFGEHKKPIGMGLLANSDRR